MPELKAFLSGFPDKKFLINFKSNADDEGQKNSCNSSLKTRSFKKTSLAFYGGRAPTNEVLAAMPKWTGYTKPQVKSCLIEYLAYGWTGIVPAPCQNRIVAIPANYAWVLWGWPNRFQQRLSDVGSTIILLGPMSLDDPGSAGIDQLDQLKMIPKDFDGYVWTNRIEVIGARLKG